MKFEKLNKTGDAARAAAGAAGGVMKPAVEPPLVNQPSAAPTEKAKAGIGIGALAIALVAAATALADLEIPGLVGTLIGVVAAAGAFYLKRERATLE